MTDSALFDDILAAGWAPEFLAARALEHMRDGEIEAAAAYTACLSEMCRGQLLPPDCEKPSRRQRAVGRACAVAVKLKEILTHEERLQLGSNLI